MYIFEQETDHQWKKGDVLKHLYYAHSFSAAWMVHQTLLFSN